MEVEPLDHTKLEDLGLNTCSHVIFLSSREIPSVDEPEPQLLPNFSPLDVNLGDKRGTDPPIKPHSPDSFRLKVVDKSTINTPPSTHVVSFHPKDTYCYYHPCIDDLKKHYGFKPGLLGQSGSLGVDFSNMKMIENDWELESKEVSFLRKALGWLLEEIHVTWAHLEKKRTRLRLYTKSIEEIIIQTVETASPTLATTSELDQDSVRSITTASECSRLK
ncbi:hypothetical protein Tco_0564619 [Tanacetum coccineum]